MTTEVRKGSRKTWRCDRGHLHRRPEHARACNLELDERRRRRLRLGFQHLHIPFQEVSS